MDTCIPVCGVLKDDGSTNCRPSHKQQDDGKSQSTDDQRKNMNHESTG